MPSELHDLLDRVADRPVGEPDFEALARTGRRRRYQQRAVSALAVVAVIALTSTVMLPRLRPPAVTFDTAPRTGVGTWESVPPSPLGARVSASAFADGDRVIVYGGIERVEQGDPSGDISRYDGAVYDLKARTWTRFPAPPLSFDDEGLTPQARLTDDGRLLVMNSEHAAALYDFDTRRWLSSGTAPLDERGAAVVEWTGDRLVIWGGWTEAGERGDGAVWHPETGWTPMAPSPLGPRDSVASAWTGDRLLIWGGAAGSADKGEERVFADGAAYDPVANRWTAMAPSPLAARQQPVSQWTGTEWIVAGGFGAERVREPAAPPVQTTKPTTCENGVCTGGASVTIEEPIYGGGKNLTDGASYDPRADRWTSIAAVPETFRKRSIAVVADRIVTGTRAEEAVYNPESDQWEVANTLGVNPLWDSYNVGGTIVALNSGENLGMTGHDRPRRLGGLVYNRDAQRWDALSEAGTAQRSSPAIAVTGDKLFVWGGLSVTRDMEGYQGEPGAWRHHDDGAVLTLD